MPKGINQAFYPGQRVTPSAAVDLTDLTARVGILEGEMVTLTARVAALEAASPLVSEEAPPEQSPPPRRSPRPRHS